MMPDLSRPRFVHYIEYAGWQLVSSLLRLLPRRMIVGMACLCGAFLYHILRVRRREVEENLAAAFGDGGGTLDLRRVALETYKNSVLTFFEIAGAEPSEGDDSKLFEEPVGWEYLEQALRGQAIILSAHIGNWEVLGLYGRKIGIRLVTFAKPLHNPLVNKMVLEERRRRGLEIRPVSSMLKGAVDAVREGAWLGIIGDQDAGRRGIFVDFLGRPASTFQGAALLAWKLNLPITPAFCIREQSPLRPLRLIIMPLIHPDPSAPRDAEITRLTRAHVASLEKVIAQYPESYFWFHRRWKTRPRPPRVNMPAPDAEQAMV
ncbi:MAG: lysophospholipid acyltransferase family protein [bacterium]|nr:lysophospholipid acyltransferase family protein [Candidatus Sumerlaeota bacterium]